MPFTQNLANAGPSGVYGSIGPTNFGNVLDIVNQVKDREMRDFEHKANFMADLSLRQDRTKRLYDQMDESNVQFPTQSLNQGQDNQGQARNVIFKDPSAMTAYEKGELGLRQQQLGLESQRISQAGKFGQEKIDVEQEKQKLAQQKSDQINTLKQQDLERKINEATQKVTLAQQRLEQSGNNFQSQLEARKTYQSAVEERHKLEMDMKQHQFDMSNEQHKQQIDAMQKRLDQASHTKKTTTVNPEGTQKTEETTRGSQNQPVKNPDGSYKVTGPDGNSYNIPADKLNDWMQNHQPDENNEENNDESEGEE